MPKPEKKIDVTLNYNAQTQKWGMTTAGKGQPVAPDEFAPIKIDYGYEGKISFTIAAPSDVTFADDNPFLAAAVTDPASKPTALDPQFTVSKSPKKLVIRDLNGVPGHDQQGYDGGDFNYVLNFKNAQPLDPIISNGGCCRPTGQNSNLMYFAVGAVALLALLVLIIRPILARRTTAAMRDRDRS